MKNTRYFDQAQYRFFTSFIMTAFLLIISLNLFSQTYQPTQQKLFYNNGLMSGLFFLDKHPDFQQKRYNIGWHWSQGYKMSQVLSSNQIHLFQSWQIGNFKIPLDDTSQYAMAHNVNIIINTPYLANHGEVPFQLSLAKALVFEPTYKVDISNPHQTFVPREFDTTRYAFGFTNIRGFITNSNSDPNYNRLQLFKDSLNNEVVLSGNWVDDQFSSIMLTYSASYTSGTTTKYRPELWNFPFKNFYEKKDPFTSSSKDTIFAVDWMGVNNYLNINLRRLDTNDIAENDDIVLSIRMPYKNFNDTTIRYIRFDSIPNDTASQVINLPNSRGLIRKLKEKVNVVDSVIYITRSMLPKGNAAEKDITISAWFACDGKYISTLKHNFGLKNLPLQATNETIEKLNIEVHYYDTCDIGIDWISINNRATRELSMGYLDTVVKNRLDSSIAHYTLPNFRFRKQQPFRWYLLDEPNESSYWYVRHYLTRKFGHIFTQEGGYLTPQYHYYINPKENWWGVGKGINWVANPYIPYHRIYSPDSVYRARNFGWPSNAAYMSLNDNDSTRLAKLLVSEYEIYATRFNQAKENNLLPLEYPTNSAMKGLEVFTQASFLDSNINEYLFNQTPWWGQIWIDVLYRIPGRKNQKYLNGMDYQWLQYKHLTGEEFRYLMNRTILYGAKGFVVDGESTQFSQDTSTQNIRLHHGQDKVDSLNFNNLAAWEFLDKNEIGGDFLDINDNRDELAKMVQFDTLLYNTGISPNRYYVARKSNRREFKKLSEFIRNNDSLIMRMQLISAYTKAYRDFIIHSHKTSDTVLTKYLKHTDTRTRPLNRIRPYYEQEGWDDSSHTSIDSGFYDLTILKDAANLNIDSSFYLGVLNKRTGPHLWLDSADCGKKDSVSFITTAELDSLTDSADSLKWRKYYWKRLGTREITLFFNDVTFNRTTKIIKVSELESFDTTGLGNWSYWRKEKYKNRINTTFYPNQPLKVKLLPGDGKLLKIESKDLTPADTICDCDKVLPKTVLDIKRAATDSCYTFNLEIYPCPNKVMDNLRVYLFKMSPCFKKQFIVQIYKNGDLDTTGFVDLTSNTVLNFPTGITTADGKVEIKVVLCPINGSPFCVPSELDSMFAVIQIAGANCPNPLDVISSVKLDNFNQDFNKFFQSEFNNFTIVPNPATTFIDLSFETPLSINSKVYIVDEQGRILKERIVTADTNEKLTIDVNQLSNGTYFIAVYDKDKLIKGKPFLIMK